MPIPLTSQSGICGRGGHPWAILRPSTGGPRPGVRRLVFNVLIANRDDQLRNHGFLRAVGGWRLAPAFDVNPSPGSPEHTLAIDEAVGTPDLELVRETAPFYRLSSVQAGAIVEEVRSAVAGWRQAAQVIRIPATEIELMAAAFAR